MRRRTLLCGVTLLLAPMMRSPGAQPASAPRLIQTIPLSGVSGRIDHLSFDSIHQRLFVAALGNNTVEVVDLASARVIHTIAGLAEPQGVLYEPTRNRLWIANGRDGTVRLFDATTFAPVRSIPLGEDADNIRETGNDPANRRIVVGYGDGALAIFSPDAEKLADIALGAHPESFQIETAGPRIFVNLPNAHKVAVVDRDAGKVIASWPTGAAASNFPMALDEADGRLFIVCRRPAVLLVLDTHTDAHSGAIVAQLPTVGDADDLFFDAASHRLLVSGGAGAVALYQQRTPDRYTPVTQIDTVPGARTSLLVPALQRLFLAVRAQSPAPASIRVYDVGR